jgi:high-affinity iron transporter
MRLFRLLLALAILFVVPTTWAASPQEDLAQADQSVTAALQALDTDDVDSARQRYQEFRSRWQAIEDGIRDVDGDAYQAIETAMRETRQSLSAEPFDAARARTALRALHEHNEGFFESSVTESATPTPSSATDDAGRLQALVVQLDNARAELGRHDTAAALRAVDTFERNWPAAEGLVKAKSPATYTATEDDIASVEALLERQPPREDEASQILGRMRDRLAPIVAGGANYGMFDAFVIMLREGLEALLVIGALTAFLQRTGNRDKQHWIWGGAALGVVLSIVLAVVLQQVFSRAEAGLGSELVEGLVGVGAAAMLFYVSYWLHSKSRLGAWQRYIHERSSAALARGSMVSLTLIALLAVFREGAETAVFYLGIAPSIAPADLIAGLVLGVAALVVVGFLLLLVGLRLPLRPFFLASSLLIYYLGFKFVGTGVHALQVAGVVPATPAPLPGSDVLGVYPTWETALPQVVLLLAAGLVVYLSTRQRPTTSSVAVA